MKHLFAVSLSVAVILVGCESNSSSADSYTKGDLVYERNIEPNLVGSMSCKVYATDDVVTVDEITNLFTDDSNMGFKLETNFGKNPATYRGEYIMDGAFLVYSDQECEAAKEQVANRKDGKTSCSDKKVTFSAILPEVNEKNKSSYMTNMIKSLKEYCDNAYDTMGQMFDEMINQVNSKDKEKEKATSCKIQKKDNNDLQTVIIYTDKSYVSKATNLGNYKYSFREEFTGLDDATLENICKTYKKKEDLSNVKCSGSVFTFEEMLSDIETVIEAITKVQCPAMLSGGLPFESIWE